MSTNLWVGQLDDKSLVYDPDIQLPSSPHLFLWDAESRSIRKYDAALVRKYITRQRNACIVNQCISSYEQWKASDGEPWLNQVREFYESSKPEALEERHKRRLEELGAPYRGVRKATRERPRRITHCYQCSTELDNAIDLECIACGWILCNCGACGCGYRG